MKKSGILNGPINARLSTLGHGHLMIITDCGMPLPDSAAVVDLALVKGIPGFAEVLRAMLADIKVEGAVIACEASGTIVEDTVRDAVLSPEFMSHEELKHLLVKRASSSERARQRPSRISRCGAG